MWGPVGDLNDAPQPGEDDFRCHTFKDWWWYGNIDVSWFDINGNSKGVTRQACDVPVFDISPAKTCKYW
ncbi:hypothetical protein ACIBI9_56175 [Nonomuraea sp. NPDC050451]|uniref:hypothetical protein n=1 Tax=Nonomuraea sp. NPDC050451 TaxID=3364364 RepID=UPI003797675F